MSKKALGIGGGLFGTGLLAIAGVSYYGAKQRAKLIEEFLDKIKRGEAAYKSAIEREDYEGAKDIAEYYEGLMRAEERVLEKEGLIPTVLKRLRDIGIIVTAGYISIKIISWLLKKYPPKPPYVCPVCGAGFATLDQLNEHVKEEHGLDTGKVPEAEAAYNAAPSWVQNLLANASGVGRAFLDAEWAGMPVWQLLVIAAAAIVLILLTWWFLGPYLAPVAAMAGI